MHGSSVNPFYRPNCKENSLRSSRKLAPYGRLRLTKDIRNIQKNGFWVRGNTMAVGVAPNKLALNRMAVRLRKGIKPAVLRNRLKRLIREAFRSQTQYLKPGFDFVLSVLITKEVSLDDFKEDLQKLCSRARLLSQEK